MNAKIFKFLLIFQQAIWMIKTINILLPDCIYLITWYVNECTINPCKFYTKQSIKLNLPHGHAFQINLWDFISYILARDSIAFSFFMSSSSSTDMKGFLVKRSFLNLCLVSTTYRWE